jgi:hypothetical protein
MICFEFSPWELTNSVSWLQKGHICFDQFDAGAFHKDKNLLAAKGFTKPIAPSLGIGTK